MRFYLFLLILGASSISFSQLDPEFASEGQNSVWFNPASIGTISKFEVNAIGRTSLLHVNNGPNTFNINSALKIIHLKKGDKSIATGAVGLNYRYDEIGFMENNSIEILSNLQFDLGNTYLSFGISPGINKLYFNGTIWVTPSDDPTTDPLIPLTNADQIKFTMGTGINWYNRKFSLGISSSHLFAETYDKIGIQKERHYYINGSYNLELRRKFALRGVATVRTADSFRSFTGMLYGVFGGLYADKQLAVGIGTRATREIIGGVNARFEKFSLGYFAEYSTSKLTNGNFTHELRIAFQLFDSNITRFSPVIEPNF